MHGNEVERWISQPLDRAVNKVLNVIKKYRDEAQVKMLAIKQEKPIK
jgi:hypothetical protein